MINLVGQDIFTVAATRAELRTAMGDLSTETKEAIDSAVEQSLTETKEYIRQELSNVTSFETKLVDTLPDPTTAQLNTLYFVPKDASDPNNHAHWEYIIINGRWELIGNTEFNIEDYVTKEQVRNYINEAAYSLLPATDSTLGGVKVDTNTIQLSDDGKISINTISSNQLDELF